SGADAGGRRLRAFVRCGRGQGHGAHPPALQPWGLQCGAPLSLQFLLQLLEEAPVGPLSDELLRARLDHADLVEAEGVKAYSILGVVLPPRDIGDLLQGLEREVVVVSVAPV